ncbi:MAG: hypothetical protein M3P38_10475 [Chloroflexota bacterium]|nr:hypothetical protein [Chloroflexota bacterium]
MLPNPGIEGVLRRELDSLPLPSEEQWLPGPNRYGRAPTTAAWLVGGTMLIAAALVAGPALRDWRDSQSEGQAARPTPLVRPTVVNGVGVAPLRNMLRNPTLGYNIVLPADWRESGRWQSVPGDAALIGVATYTAHSPERELALLARYGTLAKLPWDVTAELWSSNGLSPLEWARNRGGCSATCIVGNTKINGVNFLTTVDSVTRVHYYYVERGDRVLAFSFIVGSAADQPEGVTADTLEQIVRSVGLP